MLYSIKLYHNALKLTEYVNNRDINIYTKRRRLKKIQEIKKKNKENKEKSKYKFKLKNSLTRSKQKLFDYAMENDFKYFFTGTFNQDRDNYKKMIRKITQMIRDLRKKGFDIKYLFIPELHSDLKNWHIHGLLSGIDKRIYNNSNGYFSWKDYDKFGFNSISIIKDYDKTCSYITKYITKQVGKIPKGQPCYFCSRGLKLPIKKEFMPKHDLQYNNWDYISNNCKIKTFKI